MSDTPPVRLLEVDYRRLLWQDSTRRRRAVVLVHHEADKATARGIDSIRDLSAQGWVKPMLVASLSASGTTGECLIGEEHHSVDLLSALARAGQIQRLDLVSVYSFDLLDSPAFSQLAQETFRLWQQCDRLAPAGTRVKDVRIALPRYNEAHKVRFEGGHIRIVVVPEDRRLASAMARPLDGSDPESFGLHIAVETLSLCGLWNGMRGDPLAEEDPADAKPDLVRVARSQVRSARLYKPPPTDASHPDGRLPVPAGMTRTPTPEAMAQNAVELLIPQGVRLPPEELPPDWALSGWPFFKSLIGRVATDFRNFPKRLRSSLADHVQRTVDELAETMLASDPLLVSLWRPEDPPESDAPAAYEHISRPVEVSMHGEWNTLVQTALGVADGANCAVRVRNDAAGDQAQVLASLRHLVGARQAQALPEVFTSLAGSDALDSTVTEPSDDSDDDEAETSGIGTNSSDPSTPVPTDGAPALLQLIGEKILGFKHEADRRVRACHFRLEEMNPRLRWQTKPTSEMSAAVPVCLAVGLLLAVLAWSVLFPPLSDLLRTDDIVNGLDARARLWVLSTGALALVLLVLNMPRETIRQQRYLILGAAAIVGIGATLMVWTSPVRSVLAADYRDSEHVAWVFTFLFNFAIVVCLLAMIKRDAAAPARWSAGLLLVYLLALAVLLLNDIEFRPPRLDEMGTRLLVIATCTAVTLVLVSYAMLTFVYYRHQLKVRQWQDEAEWLLHQNQVLHEHANVQDSLYTQWAATACALHRIIRLPYGEPADCRTESARGSNEVAGDAERNDLLVKATFTDCEFTSQGLQRFEDLMRADLVRPGWLHAQYHRAAEAYRSAHGVAPEACAYPLHFGEQLLETTDGDRWPFVQQLYSGDFDEFLRKRMTDVADGEGLDELFSDIDAFKVWAGAHPDVSPSLLLAEIADDPEPSIPPTVFTIGGQIEHGNTLMRSTLWWPERLSAPDSGIERRYASSPTAGNAVVHQAVRVDLSDPIPLSALTEAEWDTPPVTRHGPAEDPATGESRLRT